MTSISYLIFALKSKRLEKSRHCAEGRDEAVGLSRRKDDIAPDQPETNEEERVYRHCEKDCSHDGASTSGWMCTVDGTVGRQKNRDKRAAIIKEAQATAPASSTPILYDIDAGATKHKHRAKTVRERPKWKAFVFDFVPAFPSCKCERMSESDVEQPEVSAEHCTDELLSDQVLSRPQPATGRKGAYFLAPISGACGHALSTAAAMSRQKKNQQKPFKKKFARKSGEPNRPRRVLVGQSCPKSRVLTTHNLLNHH